ncbi:DNA-directed RNA polymerase III subunit RPC3-like isoform X2 [Tetranychus urticae]|uniref:DNA-directed RNA polymerase III subunit RPC3 n=1 Tax=Tetranychus urticae TaxID=32264 RepID=T1K8K1_TETUR|nr:DNA-directed RNA polymerase III subunit RPC3-like isoform X2 [Tetranychus urticae]
MSVQTIRLCSLLLKEYFGEIISNVGKTVMNLGQAPLKLIWLESKEKLKNCKKALTVLIKHCLVTIHKNSGGLTEYKAEPQRILYLLRYPKYIYIAKREFGDFGEQIIEEILMEGILTADDIIEKVYNRMKNSSENRVADDNFRTLTNISEVLVEMIKAKYIIRACVISNESNESIWFPSNIEEDEDVKDIQQIATKFSVKLEDNESLEPVSKRRKKDPVKSKEDVYYVVNSDQFHLYLRDMTILEGLKTHYDDEKAAQLVLVMLRLSQAHLWAKETVVITKTDIVEDLCPKVMKKGKLPKESCSTLFSTKEDIEEYLTFVIEDNSRFVVKVDERSGVGMYRVNIMKIYEELIHSSLASIVSDRFGSQCGRIFRLLLTKKYLHQKQIEELAMVPAKDAKECTYNLMTNNFIRLLQYPKGSEYAPAHTYFIFNVDLEEIVRSTIERCYQAIFNCIIRRNHENEVHKILIDRKTFIDAVITNLRLNSGDQADVEPQIEELNQSFSTHDKELLERLKKLSHRLELCELQVDDTLFLFQSWLSISLYG